MDTVHYLHTINDVVNMPRITEAIDSYGIRRSIENASENEMFTCVECGEEIIVKRNIYHKKYFSHLHSDVQCSLRILKYDERLTRRYCAKNARIVYNTMVEIDVKPIFKVLFTYHYVIPLDDEHYIIDPRFQEPANMTIIIDLRSIEDIHINDMSEQYDNIYNAINIVNVDFHRYDNAEELIHYYKDRITNMILDQYETLINTWIEERYDIIYDKCSKHINIDKALFNCYIPEVIEEYPIELSLVATNYENCSPDDVLSFSDKNLYNIISQFYCYKDLLHYVPKPILMNYLTQYVVNDSYPEFLHKYFEQQLTLLFNDTVDNKTINVIGIKYFMSLIHDLCRNTSFIDTYMFMQAEIYTKYQNSCIAHVKKIYVTPYQRYLDISNLSIYLKFRCLNSVTTNYYKIAYKRLINTCTYEVSNVIDERTLDKLKNKHCNQLQIDYNLYQRDDSIRVLSDLCKYVTERLDKGPTAHARHSKIPKGFNMMYFFDDKHSLNKNFRHKHVKMFIYTT